MIHSLRFRLIVTMIAVVIVTVGTIAVFINRRVPQAFERYAVRHDELTDEIYVSPVLTDIFTNYYAQQGSWADVEPFAREVDQMTDIRVILLDQHGRVVIDTNNEITGNTLSIGRFDRDTHVVIGEDAVGAVIAYGRYETRPVATVDQANSVAFNQSLDNSLMMAVGIAVGITSLLTYLLSGRLLKPVQALTLAARSMEKGQLHQRVAVQSKDEIGELATAFNSMSQSLATIEKLRRYMVSDVAHELRTPLTSILGYLEALQDGMTTPNPTLINTLHEEATLLRRIVDDLQELALAEAGQLKLIRQRISLSILIDQMVTVFQPQLAAQRLTITQDIPTDLPPIYADGERIGQVLRNLFRNAMVHTPSGGEIRIVAAAKDGVIEVQIADTGVGISEEHLPYVFERFYRVDDARSRSTGGAGLGLAIVKQLIEAHRGEIWAKSHAGDGATFVFTLPLSAG